MQVDKRYLKRYELPEVPAWMGRPIQGDWVENTAITSLEKKIKSGDFKFQESTNDKKVFISKSGDKLELSSKDKPTINVLDREGNTCYSLTSDKDNQGPFRSLLNSLYDSEKNG